MWLWQSVIPVAISRVNQFDAARLDVEMSAMLKEQLVKVFTLMKVFLLCLFFFFTLLLLLLPFTFFLWHL